MGVGQRHWACAGCPYVLEDSPLARAGFCLILNTVVGPARRDLPWSHQGYGYWPAAAIGWGHRARVWASCCPRATGRVPRGRSEERRVGKGGRGGGATEDEKEDRR